MGCLSGTGLPARGNGDGAGGPGTRLATPSTARALAEVKQPGAAARIDSDRKRAISTGSCDMNPAVATGTIK
jgi:hypothetical protein